MNDALNQHCGAIADQVVPAYRGGKVSYSCTGHIAKQWGAAYDAAAMALGSPEAPATGKACILCGCSEDLACVTDKGPCAWSVMSLPDVPICTACEYKARQIHLAVDLYDSLPF